MRINPSEPKQVEKPSIKKIIYELVLTLNSRARPYSEVKDLERDFQMDTGYCPALLAYEMGFPTFEAFIKCEKMKKYVSIRLDEDGQTTLYLPHPNSKIKHIRCNLLASDNYVESKKEKDENEKMARAMQPEFRGMVLEGKRRLVDLAYKLGAEVKDISYQEVQTAYLEKYKVVLAKDELRKFFARDSPSKILIELCCEEFVVSRSDVMNGMIFLRLRKPYKEIVQMHTEKLALQEQYEKSKKNERKQRKFAPFPYDRSVRRKGFSSGMDLMLRPVLPKIAMEYTDELNVETVFGDSSEKHYEKPSKFSLPRSLIEKHVKFASPFQNLSNQQISTNELFSSSLFNNKNGGCISSSVCKSFEDEYGGKANRKVQNTLRHLKQVHRRSSSSEQEELVELEGTKKPVMRTVNQRNAFSRQLSTSSDGEEAQFKNLHPEVSLSTGCDKPAEVVVSKSKFSRSTSVKHRDQTEKKQVESNELRSADKASLPPMGVQTRWKPVDSSSDDEPDKFTDRNIMIPPKANFHVLSDERLGKLDRRNVDLYSRDEKHTSSELGSVRGEALRDFIHAVVHLRSPQFVDFTFLLEALYILDPNYEDALKSLSLRQFIKQNCDNAVVGIYNDSVIVGWRE